MRHQIERIAEECPLQRALEFHVELHGVTPLHSPKDARGVSKPTVQTRYETESESDYMVERRHCNSKHRKASYCFGSKYTRAEGKSDNLCKFHKASSSEDSA